MRPDARAEQLHRVVWDDLKAYADGELSPWRRLTVRRHLSRCAACREEVNAMQQMSQKLRTAEPVASLNPALKARILSQVAAVPTLPAPRRPDRLLRYGFAASVAVSLVFAVLLVRTGIFPASAPLSVPNTTPVVPRPARPLPAPTAGSAPSKAGPVMRSAAGDSAAFKAAPSPAGVPVSPRAAPPSVPSPPVAQVASAPRPSVAPPGPPMPHALPPPPAARQVQAAPLAPAAPPPTLSASDGAAPKVPGSTAPIPAEKSSNAAEPQRAVDQAAPPLPAPLVTAPPPPPAPAMVAPMSRSFAGPAAVAPTGAPPAAAFAPGIADRARKPDVSDQETPVLLGDWPVIGRPKAADAQAPNAPVIVEANWQVDAQGRVSDIRFRPTGRADLDGAVRDAVGKLRFKPAVHQGKPVAARISHTFVIAP